MILARWSRSDGQCRGKENPTTSSLSMPRACLITAAAWSPSSSSIAACMRLAQLPSPVRLDLGVKIWMARGGVESILGGFDLGYGTGPGFDPQGRTQTQRLK